MLLPSEEDFPYAIRSVTEIMSQNGNYEYGGGMFELYGIDGCWGAFEAAGVGGGDGINDGRRNTLMS